MNDFSSNDPNRYKIDLDHYLVWNPIKSLNSSKLIFMKLDTESSFLYLLSYKQIKEINVLFMGVFILVGTGRSKC